MFDGTLKFDTAIDKTGFQLGLSGLGSIAKTGMAAVTTAITAAAGAVSALGGYAINVGKDFESSMAKVIATMGITKDTVQDGVNSYDLLKEAAAMAGESTTFSASEAADALNYLALAGYSAAQSADALPQVLNLASAGGLKLAYASDLATDAMAALGIAANGENLRKFGDEMAKTASKSNTSVAQLGEAILTVGGTAKELAGGTVELNTALGVLANVGIKGSEGGTALRNIMLAMTPTTTKAAEAFERLNLKSYDANGNLRPLNETFKDLNKSLSGMTSQEKTNVLNDIFHKVDLKSASAMLAACASSTEELGNAFLYAGVPAENLSEFLKNFENGTYRAMTETEFLSSVTKDFGVSASQAGAIYSAFVTQLNGISFEKLYSEIENCDGAMADMAHTMNDTLDGDIKSLQSKAEAFGIAVYEDLNEPLRDLVSTAGSYVSQLTSAFKDGGFEGLAESFGDVLGQAVTKISEYIPKIAEMGASVITEFVGGIVDNMESISETASEIMVIIVDTAVKIIPQVLSAGLEIVGTLAQGLAKAAPQLFDAAIDGISQFIDGLTDNLPAIVEAGMNILTAFADSLKDNLPMLGEKAVELMSMICDTVVKNLPELLNAVLTIRSSFIDAMFDAIPEFIDIASELIDSLVDFLIKSTPQILAVEQKFLMGIVEAFPEIISELAAQLPKIVDALIEIMPELAEGLNDAISAVIDAIAEVLPVIVGSICDALPDFLIMVIDTLISLVPSLLDGAITLFTALVDAIPIILQKLIPKIPEIVVEVIGTLMSFNQDLKDAALDLFMEIVKAIPKVITGLAEGLAELWDSVSEWWSETAPDAISAIAEWLKTILDNAVQGAVDIVTGVMEFLDELPAKIGEMLGTALGNIVKWSIEAPAKAKEAGKEFLENVKNFFSRLPETAKKCLDKVITKVADWSKSLKDKGKNAAKDLTNTVANSISSLPQKMADAGKNLVHGLWNGITNAGNWLKEKISDFGNGIINGFKSAFGIASPSKVMRDEVGKYLAEGIGVGFTEEIPDVGKDAVRAFEQLELVAPEIDMPELSIDVPTIESTEIGLIIPEIDIPELIIKTEKPEISIDSGAVTPQIDASAFSALRNHSMNINSSFAQPSAASEIINNHYTYSTENKNNSDISQEIVINACLNIDGETVAEGVGDVIA